MSTNTRTPTKSSVYQSFGILWQIQKMLSAEDWIAYTYALHSYLTHDKMPEVQASSPTISRLFQTILAEELTPDVPRTLPTSFPKVYPWAKMDMTVIMRYLRWANMRDTVKDNVKNVRAAKEFAMRWCAGELDKRSGETGENDLINQLNGLTIQGEEDALIERFGDMKL